MMGDHAPDSRVVEFIECGCRQLDHTLRVEYETIDHCHLFTIYTTLSPEVSFWRRIWNAIKYIFKYDYPIEADTDISPEQALKIRNICNLYLDNNPIKTRHLPYCGGEDADVDCAGEL